MKVLVLESTVLKSCVCNSWLTHWEKCSGLRAISCSEKLCRRLDVVGTQVKKINDGSLARYIIPLCKKHSKVNAQINIPTPRQLVKFTTDIKEVDLNKYEYFFKSYKYPDTVTTNQLS